MEGDPGMRHTVQVTTTWTAIDTLEFDTEEEAADARDALNRGELPEALAGKVDASGAALTDWSAVSKARAKW